MFVSINNSLKEKITKGENMIYDSIIIGGGPAGLTAGIYLARANKKVAVIERMSLGGQVAEIALIENYPGFESITGAELSMNMYKHAKNLGVEFVLDEAISYELKGEIKKVVTRNKTLETRTVVLALGSETRALNVENEKRFVGKGLSYCATCDGNFFKGKDVAVVGSGDSAISNALYLSSIAKKVYVVSKYDPMKLKNYIFDDIKKEKNVEFILKATTTKIIGSEKVEGLEFMQGNIAKSINAEGIFVSIGRNPDTENLKGLVDLDEKGYIVTDANMQTSISGVFAAGDVVSGSMKQVVSAASGGAMVSASILDYLASRKKREK